VSGDRLLARVDQGDTGPIPAHVERRLVERLDGAFTRADAVVISDYAYGVVTAAVLDRLRILQDRFRHLIAVDARDLTRYRAIGVTLVKPNYDEARRLTGTAPVEPVEPTDRSRVAGATALGQRVLELSGAQIAAITLDADGSVVFERGRPPHRTVTSPADQSRTAGAGDTYLAAFTLALASRATVPEAAQIAARAAEIVVSQDGTSVCTGIDLHRSMAGPDSRGVRHDATNEPGGTRSVDSTCEERNDGADPADVGPRRAPALHQA
jgi:D-beta-D-heptose 7-phosphate kinase/D-beta-D-heptose 1-phosphate adenosyltransferase